MELVYYIKEQIPGASVTTDIIVGFPGETDQDFQDTLDLLEQVRLDGAFTFIYSPRAGTAAARMANQLPRKVKSDRLQELVKVQNEITQEINNALVGTVQEVLIEEPDLRNPEYFRGRTRTNKLCGMYHQGPQARGPGECDDRGSRHVAPQRPPSPSRPAQELITGGRVIVG